MGAGGERQEFWKEENREWKDSGLPIGLPIGKKKRKRAYLLVFTYKLDDLVHISIF